MPWVERIEKPCSCRLGKSGLPNPSEAATNGAWVGSIYQCDNQGCDKIYKLVNTQRDGWWWEDVTP